SAWRNGRHECRRRIAGGDRGLQVVEILLQRRLATIADRRNAQHRDNRRYRTTRHRALEIVVVVFGEGLSLACERLAALARPWLEAGKALADIGEESRFGHLAVSDNIDPAVDLAANDLRNRTAQARLIGGFIVGAAAQTSLHHIEQVGWAWQAAHVGREDPVFAPVHCQTIPSFQALFASFPYLSMVCYFWTKRLRLCQLNDVDGKKRRRTSCIARRAARELGYISP